METLTNSTLSGSIWESSEALSVTIENHWAQMLLDYDEFTITCVFTFIIHEVFFFGWYFPFFLCDFIPAFKKYKIQPDKVNDWHQQWRCIKRLLFSHFVLQFPMIVIFHHIRSFAGFSIELPLPSLWTVAWQQVAFLVVEDIYFYFIHRLLHHKALYKHIHKIHHEHAAPFGIAAEYAHPIETVFLGIGTGIGPALFCDHVFTLWVWLIIRLYQTVECHTGYDFPWSFSNWVPFWGGAEFHDHHHKTFVGNYASTFTYMDAIFGTNKTYLADKAKSKQA